MLSDRAAQVENAINRATKEKQLAQLTEALEQSTVVFGLRYNKISVRAPSSFQARRSTGPCCIVQRACAAQELGLCSRVPHAECRALRQHRVRTAALWCRLQAAGVASPTLPVGQAASRAVARASTTKQSAARQRAIEEPRPRPSAARGAQVKNFEAFRRSLPEGARLIVSKNTLLGLAADRVPGWSDLQKDIKLENAWVFANEDVMKGSVKAFLAFEKKLLEPIPKADRANTKLTEITGARPGTRMHAAVKH